MQQLTGMDASFLALETANTTGHVGGLSVLDPSTASEPLTLARLTEVMAERLPLVPVLRRKLLNVPLGLDQPYWIDDADFDIEYHVREIALPRPGSDAQLTEQVSRLHARPLDRTRPLWEIYLITGLARKRTAVYTKIHHAAIDLGAHTFYRDIGLIHRAASTLSEPARILAQMFGEAYRSEAGKPEGGGRSPSHHDARTRVPRSQGYRARRTR